jgi:hypothetical protein
VSDLTDAVAVVATVTAATGVTAATAIVAARRVGRKLHDLSVVILGAPEREVAGIRIPEIPPIGDRISWLADEVRSTAGRVETVDTRLIRHGERLARIEGEFEPDHGDSLRDRMDLAVEQLRAHAQLPVDEAHPRR